MILDTKFMSKLLILNDGSNIIKKDLSTLENYKTFLNTFSNESSLPTISQNPCINWMDKWPYQFPNIFKLDIKDVITDEKLIQEYLASYNEPENEIRAMFGLPKIGEGWISETNLFYEIKTHFYNEIVRVVLYYILPANAHLTHSPFRIFPNLRWFYIGLRCGYT